MIEYFTCICYSFSIHLLATSLILNSKSSWELKGNLLTSELTVDISKDLSLGLNSSLILGVKQDLQVTTTILDTGALTDNLGGEDQVLEPVLVDGGQGAGTGTSILGVAGVLAVRLGNDAAVGNHHNGTVGTTELLAELVDHTGVDLLPGLQLGHRDNKDEGTTTIGQLDFTGTVKLEGTQVIGNVGGAGLEFKEGFGDGQVEFGGRDNSGALAFNDKLGFGSFHYRETIENEEVDPGYRSNF